MEIGFNSGFSTLLMLLTNPYVCVSCFDLGEHIYTMPCYEKLKEKFNDLLINNKDLVEEIELLKKQINSNNSQIINNTNNNTLNKNNIINGVINNNLNVQLVQFGSENIDELDIKEALKIYLKSTGGNIISNMLKFVNLNEKYPQNHNICMSDLSRELVKIFNGKKFIVKKFKDAKGDILGKAIVNTYKIVDKIENNEDITHQ